MPASREALGLGELPLFAGGFGRARRPIQRRRRHRHRVVPLRQVARRLVRDVGLQHHHRQGRHDLRDLSQVVRAERRRSISPPSVTAPALSWGAASGRSPGCIGSRSSVSRRRSGCSTSRIRALPGRERPRRQLAVRARERQDRAGPRAALRGYPAGDHAPVRRDRRQDRRGDLSAPAPLQKLQSM